MAPRSLALIVAALAAALTALVWSGLRVLERDRSELFARYAEGREHVLEEAARSVSREVADISDDLDLASILLESAGTREVAERELHAIATIKREYLVMYARTRTGEITTKVAAYDAPTGVDAKADATLEALLKIAEEAPGKLHGSVAFAPSTDSAAWYRVFARKARPDGPVVAVALDTGVLLNRMKLQRDALARLAVVDAAGGVAALTDPSLAKEVATGNRALTQLVDNVRAGSRVHTVIDGDIARRLGLPSGEVVVAGVPLLVDGGPPWTLLVVASTQAVQTQQRTIVRRVLVGSSFVMLLLLSAAAYVLRSTFRARTLRERLKHADRLAHLTEKAEKILDHIPSGVLALSEELRVTGVNRWLSARIGAEIIGRSLESTFEAASAEDVESIIALVKRALETREPQSLHRERIALLGHEASLNIHAVPLARGIGDVSVLLVLDDLTALRRIEQRLLHSEKLVTAGQLAAGIAHEIGTPLNVARGRVELALSHLGSGHTEAENHRLVIDQIDRVTRLIQQLLDYVRPTPSAVQEVDLASSLGAVRDLLAPQATKRGVALEVEAAANTTLRADPDQVQQIIVNLVLNAIDACDKGGTVTLRAGVRAGTVVLEIDDTGHGIPRELQKQVFDPFFTTKKRGQGTGLGLWVVAQLVRAQSAEIELDSAPGQGTRVRVAWAVAA